MADTKMIRITNMKRGARDIVLVDGRNIRLGPWSKKSNDNVSDPIPITDAPLVNAAGKPTAIASMASRGEIKIEEVN
jgi:hypothetical protein